MKNVLEEIKLLLGCKADYEKNGISDLSDSEYDALLQRLSEMDLALETLPEFKKLQKKSVDNRKEEHPLLSIDNIEPMTELKSWMAKNGCTTYYLDYKYDGVSMQVKYSAGILHSARIANAYLPKDKIFKLDIPFIWSVKEDVVVNGELLVHRDDLARYNASPQGKVRPLKTPRSAVISWVSSNDSEGTPVPVFYPFQLIGDLETPSLSEDMDVLKVLGFRNVYKGKSCTRHDEIVRHWTLTDLNKREFNVELDGMVLKVDSKEEQKRMHKHTEGDQCLILENIDIGNDLENWLEKNRISESIVEYKYDGVDCQLEYDQGVLVSGKVNNKSLSRPILEALEIPLVLSIQEPSTVKGYILVNLDTLKKYNDSESGKKHPLKTPCEAAVTYISSEYPSPDITPNFFPTQLIGGAEKSTQKEDMELLATLGFSNVLVGKVFSNSNDITRYYKDISALRKKLPMMPGNLVLKANLKSERKQNINPRDKLANPLHMKALKFQSEVGITQVESIEFSCTKSGIISAVLIVSPVDIRGVEVRRITIPNKSYFDRFSFRKGDEVIASLAGDVIPKITRNAGGGSGKPIPFVSQCPGCGRGLKAGGKELTDLYCANQSTCPEVMKHVISRAVGKKGLHIKGLAFKTISYLVDAQYISSTLDIFRPPGIYSPLVDCLGETKAKKVLAGIDECFEKDLCHWIYTANIFGIGETVARRIAPYDVTLDNFKSGKLNFVKIATEDKDTLLNYLKEVQLIKKERENDI